MTVPEALAMVKQVGAVEIHGGNLRLRFPEKERARLQPALHTLPRCKTEVLAMLGEAPPAPVESGPDEPTRATANALLGRVGMRLMNIDGKMVVGLWSDLDGPEVRAALTVFHPDGVPPIRYLDGSGIPDKYKERRAAGEPVPLDVLHAMEQNPWTPWETRDRMLSEMGWSPDGIPWAEWKAAALNRLSLEQGVTGKPSRIRAKTVRDGEQKAAHLAEEGEVPDGE